MRAVIRFHELNPPQADAIRSRIAHLLYGMPEIESVQFYMGPEAGAEQLSHVTPRMIKMARAIITLRAIDPAQVYGKVIASEAGIDNSNVYHILNAMDAFGWIRVAYK